MKLTVKTLSGKQLPIEVENDFTIRQIKEVIEKEHQMAADSLKLIAYGKVLDSDDKKASDFSLKENDYIVAMVQKAKPAKKPKTEEEVPTVAPTAVAQPPAASDGIPPATDTQPPAQPAPAQAPAATTTAATQPPAQVPAAASGEALPPEVESAVNDLQSISGRSREDCLKALRAAQNIPDIAYEFLMSGQAIPDGPPGEGAGAYGDDYGDEDMAGGAQGAAGAGGAGAGSASGLGGYNLDPQVLAAIQALVNNPSFPMIRQRMIQDPQFSASFMQQLQTTQPQIFQAIQQNPGILMSLILGHDPMAGMGGGAPGGGAAHGHGGHHAGGAGGRNPPPGTISVTHDEMAAIDRLTSLGFPKPKAAEAYFACDKNEEMAANFLFESGADEEEVALQRAMQASAAGGDAGAGAIGVVAAGSEIVVNVPAADAGAGAAGADPQPSSEADANMVAADGGEGAVQADPQPNPDAAQQQQDPPADDNQQQQDNQNNNEPGDGPGAGDGAGDGGGSSLV